MTQTAVVTRIIDSRTAEITVRRSSACGGSCASCGGACSYKSKITTHAVNKACAVVGDQVTVESHTSKVIGAAMLVYIFPLAMLLAGYTVSALLSAAEGVAVAISLVAFFLGILAVVISQRLKNKRQPVTCEIIEIQ